MDQFLNFIKVLIPLIFSLIICHWINKALKHSLMQILHKLDKFKSHENHNLLQFHLIPLYKFSLYKGKSKPEMYKGKLLLKKK